MMLIPPVDLGYLLDRSRELCGQVAEAWEDAARDASGPAGPEGVAAGIDHLFAMLDDLDRTSPTGPRPRPGAVELRDLAAYGVGLLGDLAACARRVGMDDEASAAEALTVPFSVLMARQGAELSALEPVVNALAALANGLSDPGDLAQLFGLMGEIVSAVTPSVAQDVGHTEPQRPWRVLLLNRAIVATRSHRPALMNVAFDAVVEHLPQEAARFFEEGMAQMDALDYPPQVRAVMERYYLRQGPAPHTLH
jgi:hypothetical protein